MPLFERHRFITIPPRGGSSVLCAITAAAAAALLLASLTNYLYDGELLKVCVARPLGFANGNWGIRGSYISSRWEGPREWKMRLCKLSKNAAAATTRRDSRSTLMLLGDHLPLHILKKAPLRGFCCFWMYCKKKDTKNNERYITSADAKLMLMLCQAVWHENKWHIAFITCDKLGLAQGQHSFSVLIIGLLLSRLVQ